MLMSRNFLVALSKISKFSDTQEWCGCLTPSEAVELMDAGGQAMGHYEKYMRERKAKGDCRPGWFYFIPSKSIKDAMGK